MPYSGTYLPHTGTGYAPMPFNYTNEPSVYGYACEESVHSGSGKFDIIVYSSFSSPPTILVSVLYAFDAQKASNLVLLPRDAPFQFYAVSVLSL